MHKQDKQGEEDEGGAEVERENQGKTYLV